MKLTGYTGLCPRVSQSGEVDRRGPLAKHGPRYLRWGLMEAAIAASSHPLFKERYQRTKRRLGRQRGAKVAQIELARKLTEAIWYMLSRNQPFKPFAPAGAIIRLTADSPFLTCATGASPDNTKSSKVDDAIETWALLHTTTNPPADHRAAARPAGASAGIHAVGRPPLAITLRPAEAEGLTPAPRS